MIIPDFFRRLRTFSSEVNFKKGLMVAMLMGSTTLLADQQINIEVRGAAFFPSSSLYKEIYSSCNTSYQIEVSKVVYPCFNYGSYFDPFFCCAPGFDPHFEIWGNLDWVRKEGSSHRLNDSTKISILNFSGGLKYTFPLTHALSVYAGIGPVIGCVMVHNHYRNSSVPSSFENSSKKHKSNKAAFGGVLKSGVHYTLNCHLFIDLFVDYLYEPVRFDSYLNLGGFKTGVGIGYRF